MAQSGRVARFKQGWELTEVCRPGHRSDVAFVEPLVLELYYTIETRGSDGSVASVGLITTVSPRVGRFNEGSQTHSQILLHVLERAIDS